MQHGSEDGWIKLTGPVSAGSIRDLARFGDVEKLSITQDSPLTEALARAFGALKSVNALWLWCDVTPAAMQHVIRIPGLRVLDVLYMRHPGRLAPFRAAGTLEQFRCNIGLTERDLLAVSTCPSLREIGAQSSALTPRAVEALLRLPALESLDIESTRFDDAMAERLSTSRLLRALDVGATRITRNGLEAICGMTQLTSLDLWATGIVEDDLDLLARLPLLEYLSIGNYEGAASLDADLVVPRLLALPSLRRIWLDGIALRPEQRAELEAKCERVRIT